MMPSPKDPTEIKRFLGMVQYIDKFIDGLSTTIMNMRKLIRTAIVWNLTQEQEQEFNTLKVSITTTPWLKYYNVNEDVVIQCDACIQIQTRGGITSTKTDRLLMYQHV